MAIRPCLPSSTPTTEAYATLEPSISERASWQSHSESPQHQHNPSVKESVTGRKVKRRVERITVVLVSLVLCAISVSFLGLGPSGVSAAPVVHTPKPSPPWFHPFKERQGQAPPAPGSPAAIDPCTTLSQLDEPYITYDHVKRCYDHVPYNATEAGIVLSTLYTLYRDYYVFLDYAMMPDQPKPFTNPPVDLLAGLDKISQTDYKSDFQFHKDIDLLINRLNDAHANYIAHCYRHYLYIQPLDLYAPVVDGVQSIRILKDDFGGNLLADCEVLTIDGAPALDTIQRWVDVHNGISKDAGVRLNKALSTMLFDSAKLAWELVPGGYTTRATLPESASLTYELRCPPSRAYPEGMNQKMVVDWEVYRLVSWNAFQDTETFLTQNCYKDTDPLQAKIQNGAQEAGGEHGQRKVKRMLEERKYSWEREHQAAVETGRPETIKPIIRRSVPEEAATVSEPVDGPNSARHELYDDNDKVTHLLRRQDIDRPIAKLIYNGTHTAYYQLLARPSIGVVVIPTHSVQTQTETMALIKGFALLQAEGVRNVILDLTGNGGGYVNFAYDLVDWMFPHNDTSAAEDNITSVYESDLRSSMSVKALAHADLADEEYESYFNPDSYSDPQTGQVHETNFFLQDKMVRRVPGHQGRAQDLTEKVFMLHELGGFEMGMPWQHQAQRIVVLTDGACGSACGMTLNRLKNRHGVKSYAVGGRKDEPLSLFSFAGASVYGLDAILNDFKLLKVDSPMQGLRYKGIYRVPVMEFFWEGEEVPIEYNAKMYAADYHLDYDPRTARKHELLWEAVADSHWTDKMADA
ncbi:hypothetical protein BGZ74_010873 [Mortierella antarctica]|nr:hypothetical protein BGZ74_010873 [Mortierella antarctica]